MILAPHPSKCPMHGQIKGQVTITPDPQRDGVNCGLCLNTKCLCFRVLMPKQVFLNIFFAIWYLLPLPISEPDMFPIGVGLLQLLFRVILVIYLVKELSYLWKLSLLQSKCNQSVSNFVKNKINCFIRPNKTNKTKDIFTYLDA